MKILVVDDEPIVARALSRAFVAKGHEVTVAHSGEEGLEKWIENSPDAVMLDVVMPGLTGPQVIEEYKKRKDMKNHARAFQWDGVSTPMVMARHWENQENRWWS